MQVEFCLDSATTYLELFIIAESPSFNTTSYYHLLFAVFRGLASAVDKYEGIGDNEYDNAFYQSMGLLFLTNKKKKNPMIKWF